MLFKHGPFSASTIGICSALTQLSGSGVMQAAGQAIALVNEWKGVSVEDALHMLSGAFKHPGIRDAAVRVLKAKASDDEVYEVMNQLVLCVRHDTPGSSRPVSGMHPNQAALLTFCPVRGVITGSK